MTKQEYNEKRAVLDKKISELLDKRDELQEQAEKLMNERNKLMELMVEEIVKAQNK